MRKIVGAIVEFGRLGLVLRGDKPAVFEPGEELGSTNLLFVVVGGCDIKKSQGMNLSLQAAGLDCQTLQLRFENRAYVGLAPLHEACNDRPLAPCDGPFFIGVIAIDVFVVSVGDHVAERIVVDLFELELFGHLGVGIWGVSNRFPQLR